MDHDKTKQERKRVHFCRNCDEQFEEDPRYCPYCGYKRKGIRIRPLRGFTVLYLMFIIMSAAFFIIGYIIYTTNEILASILFTLGTALGPVALVGLIYDFILKDSLKEAALASYTEFTENVFQESIQDLSNQETRLEDITKRLLHIEKIGLVGAFPERRFSLPYLEDAIASEEKEIFIVGTSFRGLLWPAPGEEKLMKLIAENIKSNACKVRFILTHPAFAHLRQSLEGIQRKESFHIAQEILETVKILKDSKVPHYNVRFVRGTPTVFGVSTSKVMLLNPYPLQRQAYTSVTLVLDSHYGENPAYRAFEQSHFRGVWDGTNVDSLDGYDIISLEKVFNKSLNDMGLCKSDKQINYRIMDNS